MGSYCSMGKATAGSSVKVPAQGPRGQEEEEARLGTAVRCGLARSQKAGRKCDVSLNLGKGGWQTGRYTERRGVPVLCY